MLLEDINSGRALNDPSLLSKFSLITFSDLKKYKFFYWFAFPAILPANPFQLKTISKFKNFYSPEQQTNFHLQFNAFKSKHDSEQSGFFIINRKNNDFELLCLKDYKNQDDLLIGFVDPSGVDDNPGWPLRNLLILIQHTWKLKSVNILCYRGNLTNSASSFVINVDLSTSQSNYN
jgi:ubiquitin-like modifier-activating enzyme ATG7